MTARPRSCKARLGTVGVTNTAVAVGSWFRLRIELGKSSRVESVWIYMDEKATARVWICEEKRARWKELKCPRWRILERWAHPPAPAIPSTPPPAASPPARSFQAEDSLGTKDPATGMILIEYDYLPSSSGLPLLPSRESPRAPSSSCGESCSWEFSPAPDGRMRTRSERDRVIRFNLHTGGVVLRRISSASRDRQY